jgi:hypothetical protein
MYGNWTARDGTKDYSVKIGKEETHLTISEDGKKTIEEKFDTNLHWLSEETNFLFYFHTGKYFLSFANEKELHFGELANPTSFNGKYNFHLKFSRVT